MTVFKGQCLHTELLCDLDRILVQIPRGQYKHNPVPGKDISS